MKVLKRLATLIGAVCIAGAAEAVVVQGEWTPGVYPNIKIDSAGRLIVVGDGFASEDQAIATNNYLALMNAKLPALSGGRVPVEVLTPVQVTGNVGIAGSVVVTGAVSSTLVGTPTVTLAGTPTVTISGGTVQASPVLYTFRNITSNGTLNLKSGAGILKRIVVNTPGLTSNLVIYDSLTATGTKLAGVVTSAAGAYPVDYDLSFNTGLTVVTSGGADITVVYN